MISSKLLLQCGDNVTIIDVNSSLKISRNIIYLLGVKIVIVSSVSVDNLFNNEAIRDYSKFT